jgi:phosphate transport system substrate-binding protein
LVVALCVLVAAPAAYAQEKAKEVVRSRGTESMTHIMTEYAAEFNEGSQACNIVVSGGASRIGIEALLSGENEIAMMSERLTREELNQAKAKGLDLQEAIVGWGAIVVLVHPSNPVASLTLDQLRKVLTGEYTSWSQVGGPDKGVLVVGVDEKIRGATYRFITDGILKGGTFAPGARLVRYFRSVAPTVWENEGAIGIVRMRNLERAMEQGMGKQIKTMAIRKDERSPAVAPSRESVDEGTYPITRPYYLYIAANKSNKCTAEFCKFCAARNPRPRDVAAVPAAKK